MNKAFFDLGLATATLVNILNPRLIILGGGIVAGYPEIMPTYQGQLSDEELLRLVDYVKSLDGSESASLSGSQ